MSTNQKKNKVREYYNQETEIIDYVKMYEPGYTRYPANLIRLNIVKKILKENAVKNVLDVGCGSCGVLRELLKDGFKVNGMDFSEKMIMYGKKILEESNFDPKLISVGDIEKEKTFPKKKFDAVIALGVLPHVLNEKIALRNINISLKNKGKALIEFRNDLFSAFSMNKFSADFFLNRVINKETIPKKIRNEVEEFYFKRLKIHKQFRKDFGKISYDDILAKFHNPLNIEETLFSTSGFSVDKIHFYHYHSLPPYFHSKYPKLFNTTSLKIEKPNDWRGYFMASAFVVEATKIKK
jgi:2-polyprenyl-3-methyl-5-hydroxy-6-metoxy-1,4-benzoquinol methylase